MDLQNNEPVQSFQNIWTIVISVVATVLIVGGGFFLWQKYQSNVLRQEIQALKIQNESLAAQSKKMSLDLEQLRKKEASNIDVINDSLTEKNENLGENDKFPQELYSIECADEYNCDLMFNDQATKRSYVFISDILNKLRQIKAIGAYDAVEIISIKNKKIFLEHHSSQIPSRTYVLYELDIDSKKFNQLK